MSTPYYPRVNALFSSARRPSAREVEVYAQMIAARENRAIDECREQAELQLWASRPSRPRKLPLHTPALNLASVG